MKLKGYIGKIRITEISMISLIFFFFVAVVVLITAFFSLRDFIVFYCR